MLEESKLFENIGKDQVQDLLGCVTNYERTYEREETILQEGSVTSFLGLVLEGQVLVERSDYWGNNTLMGKMEAGDIFAETYACLPDEPLKINVVAGFRGARVLFLKIEDILTSCPCACAFHTQVISNLLLMISRKNLNLSRKILHSSPKTIRGKLMSYLSQEALAAGRTSFKIPYNRQQLADYLGVDRSALSHELSKMAKEGIIEYRKNSFKIIKSSDLAG